MEEIPELDGSIFGIAPVQFQTDVSNVCCLSVASDILVIAFKSGKLFRINLNNPSVIETLELPYRRSLQELGKIDKIFQDPSGFHLLVTMSKMETFYIHRKSTVFKYIPELKGIKVSSIGWHEAAVGESNTGAFLIGDKGGGIHEAFLEYTESSQKYNKKVQRDVYKRPSSIDGLQVLSDPSANKLTVIVVSGDFIAYWNDDVKRKNTKYNDLIIGDLFKSISTELEQYQDLGAINGEKFTANGPDFAWLTTAGTVFGTISQDLVQSKRNIGNLKILLNIELPESSHKFKSIAMTKYHLILLRASELFIINKINEELVFHQSLPVDEDERFIGLSADYKQSTYWIYSNSNIYEITVDDEEKHIWRALIANHLYDEALSVARDDETRDVIYSQQGDYLVAQGSSIEAARVYALSSKWFESVALGFMDAGNEDALLEYFMQKFEVLKGNKDFKLKMQLIMLSSWIVEFYLEKLNELDDLLATEQTNHVQDTMILKTTTEKRFQEFVIENKEHLDKETVYEIITSHNRRSELLYYANLINDYDFVLGYWIRLKKWTDALKTLELTKDNEMAYKYSTVLLVNSPKITVETWLKLPGLEASKLLPAILTYNKTAKKVTSTNHHGIQFLLQFIRSFKTTDSGVHDTLLFLLISNESSDEEDIVLRYLEEYGALMNYNPDFILRLCLKYNKIQSATYIYSLLDCYEDATNLALMHDMVDLAIVIADKPDDDRERKFLWLKIADKKTSMIRPSDKQKVSEEVKFLLDKCELLTIKDLLPRIPDFTTIDNLKDEICTDLERFGTLINKLSLEMNSSIKINDNITKQIGAYSEKTQIIAAGESCALCDLLLTSRKFFIFPCSHAFHTDCLVKEILKSNDYATKKKLSFLQKKFLSSKQDKTAKFVNSPEVDALLCRRCPLCSDIKIDTIDQPFEPTGDWDI